MFKRFSFHSFCLSLVFCGLSANAQVPSDSDNASAPAPPRPHSISMEVKTVASGGATDAKNAAKTNVGKYIGVDRAKLTTVSQDNKITQNHRVVLQVTLRNFSQQPDRVDIESYFFGQPVSSNKMFIFDSQKTTVPLQASETRTINIASKEIASTVEKTYVSADGYLPLMSKRESGDKMKGWVVRLMGEGKVIQIRGSDLKYEDIGRDDAKLQALKKSIK